MIYKVFWIYICVKPAILSKTYEFEKTNPLCFVLRAASLVLCKGKLQNEANLEESKANTTFYIQMG